jgi:hypothetical protein
MTLNQGGIAEWDCIFDLEHGEIVTSMKKAELIAMIQEAVFTALREGYDYTTGTEDPETKKIRLAGRKKAKETLASASPDELKRSYLKILDQLRQDSSNEKKQAFGYGAIEWITGRLKEMGEQPPSSKSPWD